LTETDKECFRRTRDELKEKSNGGFERNMKSSEGMINQSCMERKEKSSVRRKE
jgi:hypothetical protein